MSYVCTSCSPPAKMKWTPHIPIPPRMNHTPARLFKHEATAPLMILQPPDELLLKHCVKGFFSFLTPASQVNLYIDRSNKPGQPGLSQKEIWMCCLFLKCTILYDYCSFLFSNIHNVHCYGSWLIHQQLPSTKNQQTYSCVLQKCQLCSILFLPS